METGEPVKYGQCWVFSGLLTTLMRSIGIPTRSVTNFSSAHDTENTMTIDKFFRPVYKLPFKIPWKISKIIWIFQWSLETLKSETNEPLEGFSGDLVWNFHVWNDIWVRGTGHWPAEYSGNLKPKFTQRIMVPKRNYYLINGRSIRYIFLVRKITSFRQNLEKPIMLPLNGPALGRYKL